jgi:hypothetical protein
MTIEIQDQITWCLLIESRRSLTFQSLIIDFRALIWIIITCKITKDWNLQILENNVHCTWQLLSKIERTKENTNFFHLDLKLNNTKFDKKKKHTKRWSYWIHFNCKLSRILESFHYSILCTCTPYLLQINQKLSKFV